MPLPDTAWIQSMLILHPSVPPGRGELDARLAALFPAPDARRSGTETATTGAGTFVQHWSEATVQGGTPDAELSRTEPFWPALLHPQTALVLIAGNEVIVPSLPTSVAFTLQWTIGGPPGTVQLTWEVCGPGNTTASAPPVVRGDVQLVQLRPLAVAPTAAAAQPPQVGIATPRAIVQAWLTAPGLYQVVTTLDGVEAGVAPLLVREATR